MVGFGSSLRASRRRGWEDAYLDYASLRMLLTQIEAIYEEEDWKRRSNAPQDMDSFSTMEQFDQDGGGRFNDFLTTDQNAAADDENLDTICRLFGGLLGRSERRRCGINRRRQYSTSRQQQRSAQQQQELIDQDQENNESSNWVMNYISPNLLGRRQSHREQLRQKKDKVRNALDKGGWRIPGTLDYRDELFLVSDDDMAFGYDEDDDWGDTDDEDICSVSHHQYETDKVRSIHSANIETSSEWYKVQSEPSTKLLEEQHISQKNSSKVHSVTDKIDAPEKNSTKELLDNTFSVFDESRKRHDIVETIDCDPPQTTSQSNSPGTLETSYETFAAVAAKRGVANSVIGPGSPEQGGWLDFFPNLFSWKNTKPSENKSFNPQSCISEKSVNQETANNEDIHLHTVLSESTPTRLVSSTYQTHHEYLPSTTNLVEVNNGLSHLTYSNNESKFDTDDTALNLSTPESFPYRLDSKPEPVVATALGSAMPMTPPIPQHSMFESSLFCDQPFDIDNRNRKSSENSCPRGGFGVSLNPNLIPSESTGLLTSSRVYNQCYKEKSNRENRSRNQYKFYSFQNKENKFVKRHKLDQDSGTERRSSNMISYYSINDRYFSIQSPRHQATQLSQYDDNSPEDCVYRLSKSRAKSIIDNSRANFITNFLLGESDTMKKDYTVTNRFMQGNSVRLTGVKRVRASRKKQQIEAARRKRARIRKQHQLRRQQYMIPDHLRKAHLRASTVAESFRGLLQAEVEKVILFANKVLGELSDTIGTLRYSSYEEGNRYVRRSFPNLNDGGMHPFSSSDDDEFGAATSSASSSSDENLSSRVKSSDKASLMPDRIRRYQSDSSNEKDAALKRQLILRDRHRLSRPLFQKADFLGEDFSLLSAVDEVDAYTAVGVELMHLLKFVSVNIIAVRKICIKHDHLLSNRMLGFYYHRQIKEQLRAKAGTKKSHKVIFERNEIQPQFGLLLSRPFVLGSNGGYMLGIFDTKIQDIANSTTMQTVSSSLAIALADFEASQSRSNQLGLHQMGAVSEKSDSKSSLEGAQSTLEVLSPRHKSLTSKRLREVVNYRVGGHCFRADDDSTVASNEDRDGENASTSSNISLSRLQFVVTSVFGLREAARTRVKSFDDYASRLFMTSIGPNIVGDGLNGRSRETLNFLCAYNPDTAYTLDADSLSFCLRLGRDKRSIGSVMNSCLGIAARKPASSLSIKPNLTGDETDMTPLLCTEYKNILRLNAASMFLFIVNYFIVIPSSQIYAMELKSGSCQSWLIGITNISAIFSSLIHILILSKRHSFVRRHIQVSLFRIPLIVSTVFPIIGNALYSYSKSCSSFSMAWIGRFLVGFGCAEVLNRHLVAASLTNESINTEVVRLMKISMVAPTVGLLLGSLFHIRVKNEIGLSVKWTPFRLEESAVEDVSIFVPSGSNVTSTLDVFNTPQPYLPPLPLNPLPTGLPFGQVQLISPSYVGYIMSLLWSLQLIGLIFYFDLPKRSKQEDSFVSGNDEYMKLLSSNLDEKFDSDSSSSNHSRHVYMRHFSRDPSLECPEANVFLPPDDELDIRKLETMSRNKAVTHEEFKHSYSDSINNIRRLVFSNVALPTTMTLFFLTKTTLETLLSSCTSIMSHYFAWSGAWSGLFMSAITSITFPIHIHLSSERCYTERKVIKMGLRRAKYILLLMMNYQAFSFLLRNMIEKERYWLTPTVYDGIFGILQYTLSFTLLFICMTCLESVTLTLMSKMSPVPLKKYSIDNSFMVIVISAFSRIVGDLLICGIDASTWLFSSDRVNSLCLCWIVAFAVGEYIVRKHYFFLI